MGKHLFIFFMLENSQTDFIQIIKNQQTHTFYGKDQAWKMSDTKMMFS